MKGVSARILIVWAVVIGVIIILYATGGMLSTKTFSIGSCQAELYNSAATIQSDLCPDPETPCTAQPYIQNHNAQVDAILCACANAAKGGSYSDTGTNAAIEQSFQQISGLSLKIKEICENSGNGFMIKWKYG